MSVMGPCGRKWNDQMRPSSFGEKWIPQTPPGQKIALRMKTMIIFSFVLALLSLADCGNEDPVGREPGSAPVTTPEAVGGAIHIVFTWPGDDLASRQELEIRDKIARTIEERGIGTVTRVGTGMGTMEIVVKVEQKAAARSEIEEIVREIAPHMKCYIR
jgi:hypothetical protein